MRQPDIVARLADAEFAVLLEAADPAIALKVAQRIQGVLDAPHHVGSHRVDGAAIIGIALGHAQHALADEILRDAGVALDRARQEGSERLQVLDGDPRAGVAG